MLWSPTKTVSKGEYNYVYLPEHPFATDRGYVLEHRVIVENKLNRLLGQDEVVHHVNDNKKDNAISNLEVMGRVEHIKHHLSEVGRCYVILRCPNCGVEFEVPKNKSFLIKKTKFTACSPKCRGKFSAYIQYKGIDDFVLNAFKNNLVKEYRKYLYK